MAAFTAVLLAYHGALWRPKGRKGVGPFNHSLCPYLWTDFVQILYAHSQDIKKANKIYLESEK